MKKLQSYKVTKKKTMQVRIDAELVRRLKVLAADQETSIKSLVESALADVLEVKCTD